MLPAINHLQNNITVIESIDRVSIYYLGKYIGHIFPSYGKWFTYKRTVLHDTQASAALEVILGRQLQKRLF